MTRQNAAVGVKLGGRLGNQMFQYAAGLSLANRLGGELFLDVPQNRRGKNRNLLAESFDMAERCLHTPETLLERIDKGLHNCTGRQFFPLRKAGLPIFRETGFTFDSGFDTIREGRYLIGRWQSPRYFHNVEDRIRQAFAFKGSLGANAANVLERLQAAGNTVAVHIRRGDYVRKRRTLKRHGICERAYYDAARTQLEAGTSERLSFFIFSDDPAAARRELGHWDATCFIEGNTKEEDLHLMSLCRHTIIANSSYSWWAAWLNANPSKKVFAPRQWFTPKIQARKDPRDLLPNDWHLV